MSGAPDATAGETVATNSPVVALTRPAWLTVTGPVVYRFFAADWSLLYVGATPSFGRRLAEHAAGSHWFPQVDRYSLEHFDTYTGPGGALKREAEVIRTELPRWNRKHIPKHVLDARLEQDIPYRWDCLSVESELSKRQQALGMDEPAA